MKCVNYFVLFMLISKISWAIYDIRMHTGSNWDLMVSNHGKFGQTVTGNAGGWWPQNSNHNYIFGAGVNVGAIKPNGDTSVTSGYYPHGGEVEYAPGVPYSNPADPRWRVYFSTDIDYPLNQNISIQDGYAVYNDMDPACHIPDTGIVLGIRVTQHTYTFPINWAHDMVFFRYVVKNETTYTINDIYIGVTMDFDIGNEAGTSANDRCTADISKKLFYGWQEEIEPGSPPWRPGMIGYKLLSPYPLSSYKRYMLNFEPHNNREIYLVMAGYNFQNMQYEPYDTIIPDPGDQRISINSGPLDSLAPGDSIIIDWVLIASTDSMPAGPPCPDMMYKADKAQACYDAGWHDVQVISPNGGEVVSGNHNINYSASSVTPDSLLIDLYVISENGIDTIALGQANTGNYMWNTALWPDGFFYKIIAVGYDTITFGADMSDDFFTIDNPGNTAPILILLQPVANETLSGYYDVKWFARDPEYQDSLLIDIYYKSQYDSIFQPVALGEINDSVFTWNTLQCRNGSGQLAIETSDEEFTIAETLGVFVLSNMPGGPMQHAQGISNVLDLEVLIHDTLLITGHTYKLEFLQYMRLQDNYPEYFYRITDTVTNTVLLDDYSLGSSYISPGRISDFSPIINGFSIWAHNDMTISQQNYRNDSAKVVLGNYPEDSLNLISLSMFWAYRGSRLQLDWRYHGNGGLTLLVTDLDYGDTIPYKPWNRFGLNPDSAFGWCFNPITPSAPPSDTLRPGTDSYILLCGGGIRMRAQSVYPTFGDRWIVYPSEYSPSIKGNVYYFTPYYGVEEIKTVAMPVYFQVHPVPFSRELTINYGISRPQKIKLAIYDVLGRKVATLREGVENPGRYMIQWNGQDDQARKVSAGVYFCRFESEENQTETKKIIFIKR